MFRAFLAVAVLALVSAGTSQAATDIPFVDGPRSAREIAKALNRSADFESVACAYRRPLIVCGGYGRLSTEDEGKTETFVRVSIVFHKTAPKRGYARICGTYLGIRTCETQQQTYSR